MIDAFELWCWRRLFESPLDFKTIQSVHPKGNQSWIFIGRTDAEAEAPILWLPYAKNRLIGKGRDAGKDWRQEEKGTTEDDVWMASPMWWTWVFVGFGSWWWTGKPGMLQSMGSQRVGNDPKCFFYPVSHVQDSKTPHHPESGRSINCRYQKWGEEKCGPFSFHSRNYKQHLHQHHSWTGFIIQKSNC